jgi:hypothetical protein
MKGVTRASFLIKLDDSMKNKYRDCGLELPKGYKTPGSRERGERIIEIGVVNVDRSVFRKTPEEKLKLNIAKGKIG